MTGWLSFPKHFTLFILWLGSDVAVVVNVVVGALWGREQSKTQMKKETTQLYGVAACCVHPQSDLESWIVHKCAVVVTVASQVAYEHFFRWYARVNLNPINKKTKEFQKTELLAPQANLALKLLLKKIKKLKCFM